VAGAKAWRGPQSAPLLRPGAGYRGLSGTAYERSRTLDSARSTRCGTALSSPHGERFRGCIGEIQRETGRARAGSPLAAQRRAKRFGGGEGHNLLRWWAECISATARGLQPAQLPAVTEGGTNRHTRPGSWREFRAGLARGSQIRRSTARTLDSAMEGGRPAGGLGGHERHTAPRAPIRRRAAFRYPSTSLQRPAGAQAARRDRQGRPALGVQVAPPPASGTTCSGVTATDRAIPSERPRVLARTTASAASRDRGTSRRDRRPFDNPRATSVGPRTVRRQHHRHRTDSTQRADSDCVSPPGCTPGERRLRVRAWLPTDRLASGPNGKGARSHQLSGPSGAGIRDSFSAHPGRPG